MNAKKSTINILQQTAKDTKIKGSYSASKAIGRLINQGKIKEEQTK